MNQKSRFVDSSQPSQLNNGQLNNSNYQRNNNANNSSQNDNSSLNNSNYQNYNGTNNPNGPNNSSSQNGNTDQLENNQMFDKIMSEVIHVSAFEQRSYVNSDITNHPVQDMPFKLKGLLEPNRQQLMLPDGVPAPLSVLAAQPPFTSDIRLINTIALEAQSCIDGFALHVPENVAFDFKPVH